MKSVVGLVDKNKKNFKGDRKAVKIPYKPTKLWREKIHPGLEQHRFSVIVAHRRFGKTVGTVNHLIMMAIKNKKRAPQYAYIAPFRNQAKHIAWEYLIYYCHNIPGVKVNQSDLFIEFPPKPWHEGSAGARIFIVGADHPDTLRGTYWDGCILDEYAQIKPELWNEVMRPALADRLGWAVFIGTPKGQNQFFEKYQESLRNPDWYSCMYRADESGLFDEGGRYGPAELESMKQDMSADAIRQELYCDFTASAFNVLITIDMVTEASKKQYRETEIAGAPKILGVDVARFGNDSCVITKRQGLVCYEPMVYKDIDNMTFAAKLMETIRQWKPDAVFVDSGRGEGVIDRCRQMGFQVTEVNFGGKPTESGHYVNKRAEMWDGMKQWLLHGGALPDVPRLKTELTIPEYSFDAANRLKLEPKESIKERMGNSPDLADSLALTFAYPVAPRAAYDRDDRCNTEYDLFG